MVYKLIKVTKSLTRQLLSCYKALVNKLVKQLVQHGQQLILSKVSDQPMKSVAHKPWLKLGDRLHGLPKGDMSRRPVRT